MAVSMLQRDNATTQRRFRKWNLKASVDSQKYQEFRPKQKNILNLNRNLEEA